MLDRFLPRWLQRLTEDQAGATTEARLPFPVGTEKPKLRSKWRGGDLKLVNGAAISYPIPRSSPHSLTGLDVLDAGRTQYTHSHPSPTRSGPSNVEWMVSSSVGERAEEDIHSSATEAFPVTLSRLAPPAVIRLSSQISDLNPISRSLSAPASSTPHDSPQLSTSSSSSSPIATPLPKGNLKLNTNPTFTQGTQSLRLDAHATVTTDVYGKAYNYPLAKQLSPIAEQDYFSPVSLRTPISLPTGSRTNESNASIAYTMSNASLGGSQKSEITRPSPSYSNPHPFITRQVNRTISQTSSRTQASTTSSLPRGSASAAAKSTSSEPPLLPPLSLAPPFPGPHPSRDTAGPPLRPRRSIKAMSTIAGSSESAAYDGASEVYGGEEDLESLHAESFVTASARDDIDDGGMDIADAGLYNDDANLSTHSHASMTPGSIAPSVHSEASILPAPTNASQSSIGHRREGDSAHSIGTVTFRPKRQWLSRCTPAFWTFWLGFFFPIFWLVGGWHFTRFGEQPPRLTFWEFYFKTAFWKEKVGYVLCCGNKRIRRQPKEVPVLLPDGHGADVEHQAGTGTAAKQGPRLPRWVTEKQSSDDGRLRLQDPKRSLRGISFGYPFIPRPVSMSSSISGQVRWRTRLLNLLEKPHRLFDCFYGVKLREVRGRPESRRRIIDPWIQRCRYAFCYSLTLLCVGLCVACTLLIVFNTRQLR